MAEFFTDFSNDIIGQLPANTTLRRNSDTGHYQVVLEGGVKQLRYFVPSGKQQARGLSFDAIEQTGTTEIFATLRDVNLTNVNTCRVLLSGRDDNDSDYEAYLLNGSAKRFSILRRFDGTNDIATILNPTPLPSSNDYYHVLLRVEAGDSDNISAKYWLEGTDEPNEWLLVVSDDSVQRTGWMGLLGFTVGSTVYYKNVGIGTDGDPAPTAPVDEQITLSVDSISLSMTMDSATLTQTNQLTVDDLQCQTSLDAVTLQQANVLSPDALSLTTQLADVSLISTGQLSVNDLQLTMAIEVTELQQANQLSVDNLMLSTTFESPDLSVGLTLVPDSIWLSALLDHVSLTQSHLLTVDDLTQSISLGNVTLTVAGQVIGPGTLTIGITGPSISIGISP